jgi:hypothetical protein
MSFNPYVEFDRNRSRRDATNENAGRMAWAYGEGHSTGWGEKEIPEIIDFELKFIEIPFVSYSFALDGDTLVDTRFPRCSGGVSRWVQDPNGYYIGAYVFITVDTQSPYIPTTVVDPGYEIDHFWTFAGIALKNVSPYLLNDYPTL